MRNRYAAVAVTGLNAPVKALKRADKHPLSWGAFADAKAGVITRAEILHEYLDAAGCEYRMRFESGDHHYEVSFEYGPPSLEPTLPFKMVFRVYRCTVRRGVIQEIE